MDDPQPPKDELEQYRTRTSSSGGGKGGTRRRTRVGSGGNDDESLFNEIMSALGKIERRSGRVPTLMLLANETGISVSKIRHVLAKFLSNVTSVGDTEFESSLRALLLDRGGLLVENRLVTPEEWAHVLMERGRTGEPISLILARFGLANESQMKNALELQCGVNYVSPAKITAPQAECLDLLPESLVRKHKMRDGEEFFVVNKFDNKLRKQELEERIAKAKAAGKKSPSAELAVSMRFDLQNI